MPSGLESIDSDNYLVWVLLGSLAYSVYTKGYTVFPQRLGAEKFWMTIDGTLIAPVNKYYLAFGTIVEISVQALFTSVIFLILSFFSFSTGFLNIILVIILLIIILIAGAGISLVFGSLHLINENWSTLSEYGLYILMFFSTYSIPLELFPSWLHGFIKINPIYHFIDLTRNFWFGSFSIEMIWSFLYVLVFTVLCVIFGVMTFSKLTRKYGVHGY